MANRRLQIVTMSTIDDTDRELIALLRDNARLSVVALARQLRVARATVQNRIARLEREGVIVGYSVRLKPAAEAQRIRALMNVAVEGNRTAEVLRELRGHPNVAALHSTNGRWDLVAELRADTLEEFDRVLSGVRLIEGIANTETSILLSTYKV
jgi:DNA-binding Lrp family transcriptional regulator